MEKIQTIIHFDNTCARISFFSVKKYKRWTKYEQYMGSLVQWHPTIRANTVHKSCEFIEVCGIDGMKSLG